ncbi:Acyl-CoA dehydrogenase [compost metagenome]
MLLTMKALNEGGRAFSSYVALQLDTARYSEDEVTRNRAQELVALLTPVAKAFLTDMGLETTLHGQMIFGGHGYIREWGQEQLVRDVRIAQIYEGTNGIQALDLLGRKVLADGGQALASFTAEVRAFSVAAPLHREALQASVARLEATSAWLRAQAGEDANLVSSVAVEYLHLFGLTAYAYMWARMAAVAQAKHEQDPAFHGAKLACAAFFFQRILPRSLGLEASIRAGSASLYGMTEAQF